MAIEAIERGQRVQKANGICDDCGRSECVTCDYRRKSGGGWQPDEGQIHHKLTAHGWSYIKKKLRCPTCEAKRKVVPMKQKPKQDTPREPTKRQRIEIITMLAECYDIDAGRYQQGDTDDTVAEVLGVMPGWVAEIREAEFGPDGSNDDMEKLSEAFEQSRAAFRELFDKLEAAEGEVAKIKTEMKAQKDRLDSATANLAAIKKAVGPRVQRVAGVK